MLVVFSDISGYGRGHSPPVTREIDDSPVSDGGFGQFGEPVSSLRQRQFDTVTRFTCPIGSAVMLRLQSYDTTLSYEPRDNGRKNLAPNLNVVATGALSASGQLLLSTYVKYTVLIGLFRVAALFGLFHRVVLR